MRRHIDLCPQCNALFRVNHQNRRFCSKECREHHVRTKHRFVNRGYNLVHQAYGSLRDREARDPLPLDAVFPHS